jgi:BirA family biotin operon repressor/biotin-[acetyl-CoA-carboxylase] ligase
VAICDEDRSLDSSLLSLVVPLALCDGLHTTTDVPCEIKWPNDIVAHTRKLGGVLIESRPAADGALGYAIGFGINCLQHPRHFPSELRDRVTSLNMESNHAIDRTSVLTSVLTALDGWLAQPGSWRPADICARWRDRAWGLGARVRLQHEGDFFAGNLIDIDPTAAILVQLDHGGRRLFSASNTTIVEQEA